MGLNVPSRSAVFTGGGRGGEGRTARGPWRGSAGADRARRRHDRRPAGPGRARRPPVPRGPSVQRCAHLPWWAVALGFAAPRRPVVYLQTQREARTISVSEFPLVLGLFFASPAAAAARPPGRFAAVFLVHRRSSGLKTAWNLALVTSADRREVALFGTSPPAMGPTVRWPGSAPTPAAIAANCVDIVAIALVIAIYEAELDLPGHGAEHGDRRARLSGRHRARRAVRDQPGDGVTECVAAADRGGRVAARLSHVRLARRPATSTSNGSTGSPRRSRAPPRSTRSCDTS